MKGNVYNEYSKQQFEYNYPISFKKRNKEYLEESDKPSLVWKYGESRELCIDLRELDPDIYDYQPISDYVVTLTFYNFRREAIVQQDIEGDYEIEFDITSDMSKQIFKPGIYYFSLALSDSEDMYKVLIDSEHCYFLVKE